MSTHWADVLEIAILMPTVEMAFSALNEMAVRMSQVALEAANPNSTTATILEAISNAWLSLEISSTITMNWINAKEIAISMPIVI